MKEQPAAKSVLHIRNKHRERYNLGDLTNACPELSKYVKKTPSGEDTIDFSNPEAVRNLNKSLLKFHYGISRWDIPAGYLCPPIPGRADYIHCIADLLGQKTGRIPRGPHIRCMDIGTGASCIYPLIGQHEYGWSFIGTDIDREALIAAQKNIDNNSLDDKIMLRLQDNPYDIFHGVMLRNEPVDVTICNPPFHRSQAEAEKGTLRKLSNLNKKKATAPALNFGGKSHELWCEGGEERFVRNMIRQSKHFSKNCFWFTTLISKQEHLRGIYEALQLAKATEVVTIPMGQGSKSSRIVAWTFLNPYQQKKWIENRVNIH